MNRGIFFIAGAQRSGTSYLYSVLNQHPQICMAKPEKPEPKFFLSANEVKKGEGYYLNKFYSNSDEFVINGEKSTSYIESKLAAQRIKAMFPDAKIIFVIRNPVLRAISNYFFSVANGLEKRSIREVFIENRTVELHYTTSVSPYKYIERGEYWRYLSDYYDLFGRDKIKIILFEDMIEDDGFVEEIYHFLGIKGQFVPQFLGQKVNANDVYQVEEEILRVLHQHFIPHNKNLQERLGIDLRKWWL